MDYHPYAKKIKLSPMVLAGLLLLACLMTACAAMAFIAVLVVS